MFMIKEKKFMYCPYCGHGLSVPYYYRAAIGGQFDLCCLECRFQYRVDNDERSLKSRDLNSCWC